MTALPRTLLDLGAVVPFEVVEEKAAQDAMITSAVSAVELICVLERVGRRGRRGTVALRAVVRSSLPPEGIESRLELDLLRLVERCPVPAPVLQHPIVVDGRCFRLDAAWPDLLVAVEGDAGGGTRPGTSSSATSHAPGASPPPAGGTIATAGPTSTSGRPRCRPRSLGW